MPQIGYLSNSAGGTPLDKEFSKALSDLGWEEGRNVVVHGRYSSGDYARFPGFAAELVHLGVNVIVGWGPTSVAAAKKATSTIPIVMISTSDPIAAGLVSNVSRPDANITGVALIDGLEGKRLQLLRETLPRLMRVAVLVNPERSGAQDSLNQTKRAAEFLAFHMEVFSSSRPDDFRRTFSQMKKARVQAVLVLPDAMYWTHRAELASEAVNVGLPTMYPGRDYVAAGGLLSYSASFYDTARRGASYVDKILKGARVADLPIEQPTTFELVINMKTAKALGLSLPPAILRRTDELIQ
jgi:putative ABC transport system substrate-binding protein